MHAYLGVTCHFVTKEWKILSLLLSCSKLLGRHTAESILSEFEEVISRTDISLKVYRVVTDNASNVKKAFSGSLPGFGDERDSDTDDDDQDDNDDDEQTTDSDKDDDDNPDVRLDEIEIPQRLSCFAHTLQLSHQF